MTRRVLLQFDSCPYCQRAKKELDNAGIEYIKIDIDPNDRSLVEKLSGQPSVPVLLDVIGTKDQDDDIIEWINEQK